MERLNHAVERLTLFCAYVAAAMLLAAILIVTWMVVYRASGFQNSWELETSIMLMVGAAFLGSPYTLRTKGHVGMELLDAVLPERARRLSALTGQAVGFVVCAYLAWLGWHMTVEAWLSNEHSLGVWAAPEWPKYATMPIGMGLTALQYLVEMQKSLRPASPQFIE